MKQDKVDALLRKALKSSEGPDAELIQEVKRCVMKEGPVLKKRFSARIALVAALLVMALAMVGFAYGNKVIQLLGGGRIEEGVDAEGNGYTTMSNGFVNDPVEVRDGQIYFILDGSNTNITDHCSEKTYYQHEKVDKDGYRHVVLIGGTPDNIGMAEYIWDAEGVFKGCNASYYGDEEPEWLQSARKALGFNE